jgi:hypothetical protein
MSDSKPLGEFHGKGITADLEGRVAALAEEVANLRFVRIPALQDRIHADGIAINKLFTRIIIIEAELAKQRAVNEALLSHVNALERVGYPDNALKEALREALK